MRLALAVALIVGVASLSSTTRSTQPATDLHVGFGAHDITPKLGTKPVYLAGFGQNRKAKKVHDPLMARAVVLGDGKRKIALVSVDLVGLFHDRVLAVRKRLAGFDYVLVSSTHNHEGPDTLGLWGPSPFKSGIDPDYMKEVEDGIVRAIEQADKARRPVSAKIGTAAAPELLHDGREPFIKHDELVTLRFHDAQGDKTAGIIVQWNCHPETLDSKNTEVSADFVGFTVTYLEDKYRCPVVYFTGTVGGLMTSLHVEVKDDKGKALKDGTFEKTRRYGELVGELADKALTKAKPLKLTPLGARWRDVFLPLDNKLYVAGWKIGVLERPAYLWKGDPNAAELAGAKVANDQPLAIRTEVAWLGFGELDIAAIPGEIYPELVLGKVQDPVDPGADFPKAPIEPSIYGQLKGPHRLIIGLANDEIGYILPKRQWDEKPPFCYGRKRAQYGETNSVGPETGPMLTSAFRDVASGN